MKKDKGWAEFLLGIGLLSLLSGIAVSLLLSGLASPAQSAPHRDTPRSSESNVSDHLDCDEERIFDAGDHDPINDKLDRGFHIDRRIDQCGKGQTCWDIVLRKSCGPSHSDSPEASSNDCGEERIFDGGDHDKINDALDRGFHIDRRMDQCGEDKRTCWDIVLRKSCSPPSDSSS